MPNPHKMPHPAMGFALLKYHRETIDKEALMLPSSHCYLLKRSGEAKIAVLATGLTTLISVDIRQYVSENNTVHLISLK